jgi:RNA polymerase sigma-70 factor (ECF subfamily)
MTASLSASDLADPTLLARLRAHDHAAFEMLVRTTAGRMLTVAKRFLRNEDDAQDVVQEAFIQAHKALPQFEARCALTTWLHSITVRACLMRLRRQRSRNETSIEVLLPQFKADGHRANPGGAWASGAAAAAGEEERALVRQAIDKLPEDYRNILLLRDIEEMDTREVSEYLEISESLVKTRLHRARQALRTLLEPHFQKA